MCVGQSFYYHQLNRQKHRRHARGHFSCQRKVDRRRGGGGNLFSGDTAAAAACHNCRFGFILCFVRCVVALCSREKTWSKWHLMWQPVPEKALTVSSSCQCHLKLLLLFQLLHKNTDLNRIEVNWMTHTPVSNALVKTIQCTAVQNSDIQTMSRQGNSLVNNLFWWKISCGKLLVEISFVGKCWVESFYGKWYGNLWAKCFGGKVWLTIFGGEILLGKWKFLKI